MFFFFFFQAEDGIRDYKVTGVQTCALPILRARQKNRNSAQYALLRFERQASALKIAWRAPNAKAFGHSCQTAAQCGPVNGHRRGDEQSELAVEGPTLRCYRWVTS